MKKYGLFFMMVLVMSTSAWGAIARVTASECASACAPVHVQVETCLPVECPGAPCVDVCVRGNMVIVDMVYDCEDCGCGGATCVDKCVNLGDFCPGMYSVIVRIFYVCDDPCCGSRPRCCALGSTFLRVCCPDQP